MKRVGYVTYVGRYFPGEILPGMLEDITRHLRIPVQGTEKKQVSEVRIPTLKKEGEASEPHTYPGGIRQE